MRTRLRRFQQALTLGALVASVILSFARPAAAAIPTLLGEVHGQQMALNRRLNVTAVALRYFGRPVNLSQLGRSLRAGPAWTQPIKASRMIRVLEKSGLRVSTGKGVTFTEIAKRLANRPRREIAIIFLGKINSRLDTLGYCVALTGYGPKGFNVVDVGSYVGWLSLPDATNGLGPHFNGLCLFVRPGGAPVAARIYSVTKHRQIELSLGQIASGPGMLKVPFMLRNTLRVPIGIKIAQGTCFCFKFARIKTIDHMIAPGKVGKIVLTFDRAAIGIGKIDREVLFSFTGYPNHFLKVLVRCNITANHAPTQLTWYPQVINLGVVRNGTKLGGEEFTVLTPKGVTLGTPVVSSGNIRVIKLEASSGGTRVDEFGRAAHEFVVDLSRVTAGQVNEKIRIATTDKYVPQIVVRIVGRLAKLARAPHAR